MHARITVALVERLARTKPEKLLAINDTELTGFQVRQSPTGRIVYYARFSINGRQRWPKIGTYPAMPVPVARAQAQKIINAAQQGIDPTEEARRARGEMTMAECWDLYVADLERRRRAQRTLQTYRGRWKRYGSQLGKLRLSEVTYEKVAKLHDSIVATAEADMVVRLLTAMLNWAMHPARRYLVARENVARSVEKKHRPQRRQRAIDLEGIERLAEVMNRWRDGDIGQRRTVWLLELLALTGARLNEIRFAKLEHLRDGDAYLAVPENKERNPHKTIRLGSAARSVVREARAAAFGDYLFGSYIREGRPMAAPYPQACQLFDEAGVPWGGFHNLRHTFASVARARDLSLDDIAELLGHSDPAMTRIYAQAYEEARKRKAEEVDEAIGRALGRGACSSSSASAEGIPAAREERARTSRNHTNPPGSGDPPAAAKKESGETELLTTREAARWLKRSAGTLRLWRTQGIGPPYSRFGRNVRYDVLKLEEWLRAALGG